MKLGIYGAGQGGLTLFNVLKEQGIKVDFFIDQFKSQNKIRGIPIYRLYDAPKDAEILISIPQPPFMPKEIEPFLEKIFPPSGKKLKGLGFKKIYKFEEIVKMYPQIIKKLIPFYKNRFTPIPNDYLKKLQKLFKDGKSLQTLEKIRIFRERPGKESYPFPSKEIQYFPKFTRDFFKNKKLRFVDLGAYKGDTLAWLLFLFKEKVEEILAFEPIKEFIKDIRQVLEFYESKFSFSATIVPAGVWNRTTILNFQERGASSSLARKGKKIPVFKLDEVIMFSKPNFVKMDIEGAELQALKGLEETIDKYKPFLAISVYHKAEDLWEIPFWVKSNFPFYQFKLRLHGHMLNELILYCIPQN